jgi:hypothetical protein
MFNIIEHNCHNVLFSFVHILTNKNKLIGNVFLLYNDWFQQTTSKERPIKENNAFCSYLYRK